MSYTYHGTNGIIVLPGRSISTFPSGLVRVDRTYAVRADRASVVRREFAAGNLLPFDDGTPAIDGLYIFPEPQETQRDDGFVEFRVSAYGRTNVDGYTRREFVQGETNFSRLSTSIIDGVATSTEQSSTIRTLNESVIQTFVQPAEQPFLLDIGIQSNSLKVYLPEGRLLTRGFPSKTTSFGGASYSSTNSGSFAVFGGTTTSNFGRWAEITITYNSVGFISIVSFLAR
jgi:hypothetical protein